MTNLIEKYPVVMIAGAIGAGLLLRRAAHSRAMVQQQAADTALVQDQNPWSMPTSSAMDAYQYYTTSTSNTRLVYGVGQEVNLVSTGMLENALQTEHDKIMQEVTLQLQSLTSSWDQFLYNPYDTAIAGAANGAQMAFPNNTVGGHD